MSEHDPDREPSDQDDVSRRDPEASGGDAEAAASVEDREDVATDDDALFGDPDDDR